MLGGCCDWGTVAAKTLALCDCTCDADGLRRSLFGTKVEPGSLYRSICFTRINSICQRCTIHSHGTCYGLISLGGKLGARRRILSRSPTPCRCINEQCYVCKCQVEKQTKQGFAIGDIGGDRYGENLIGLGLNSKVRPDGCNSAVDHHSGFSSECMAVTDIESLRKKMIKRRR